jgi:hypothetical protein
MQIDVGHRRLKKLGHLNLRQPQRLILKPALDARAAILRLLEDDFGLRQRFFTHGFRLL